MQRSSTAHNHVHLMVDYKHTRTVHVRNVYYVLNYLLT